MQKIRFSTRIFFIMVVATASLIIGLWMLNDFLSFEPTIEISYSDGDHLGTYEFGKKYRAKKHLIIVENNSNRLNFAMPVNEIPETGFTKIMQLSSGEPIEIVGFCLRSTATFTKSSVVAKAGEIEFLLDSITEYDNGIPIPSSTYLERENCEIN